MAHPYKTQAAEAYWDKSVSGRHPFELTNVYTKKFDIKNAAIASAGSCFAQHVGRYIKKAGYNFIDFEKAPAFLPQKLHQAFGCGMYSARYGNVYTARQLVQLFQRAFGEFIPQEEYWTCKNGFVDPFRPSLEPQPYGTVDEVLESKQYHLERVKKVFTTCTVFIFTLGLTEAWEDRRDGAIYPVVPGTSAGGCFDEAIHQFHNFTYPEVWADLEHFYALLRQVNPSCKIILTVSPVSLMATATKSHVITSTIYSKSVLRAAADDFSSAHDDVDYFPSFDIITSPATRGYYYLPDGRSISSVGVDNVMHHFFTAHGHPDLGSTRTAENAQPQANILNVSQEDIACDEEFLREFAGGGHAK